MRIHALTLYVTMVASLVGVEEGYAQPHSLQPAKTNSVINLADPAIFYFDDRYYLYGTVEGKTADGFLVYVSTDKKKWRLSTVNNGYALKKGDAFGSAGFWAPQVFRYRDTFYMAYVANEQIAIARSHSPLGPFKQVNKDSLPATSKQIDPFIFIDDDGSKYLYHVRLIKGNRLYVVRLNDDLSSVQPETLTECIAATDPWENTATSSWPVAEGPSVIKHKGLYYLFYTANDFRNRDYAVGYATSRSPMGPWTKFSGNPILHRSMLGINGTGHGDFFTDKKGMWYVFHTHNDNAKVRPRKTAVLKARFVKHQKDKTDRVVMERESFSYLYKD